MRLCVHPCERSTCSRRTCLKPHVTWLKVAGFYSRHHGRRDSKHRTCTCCSHLYLLLPCESACIYVFVCKCVYLCVCVCERENVWERKRLCVCVFYCLETFVYPHLPSISTPVQQESYPMRFLPRSSGHFRCLPVNVFTERFQKSRVKKKKSHAPSKHSSFTFRHSLWTFELVFSTNLWLW